MDGPFSQNLSALIELTITMLIKLAAVVYLSPPFLLPGLLVAVIGGWCGQIYLKAELSVKRELSNAKSPLIAHLGATLGGLGKFLLEHWKWQQLITLVSFRSCLWSTRPLH